MSSAMHVTSHAVVRLSQRGIGNDDVELIRWIGTEVEGGYFVREKGLPGARPEIETHSRPREKTRGQATGGSGRPARNGVPRRSQQRAPSSARRI